MDDATSWRAALGDDEFAELVAMITRCRTTSWQCAESANDCGDYVARDIHAKHARLMTACLDWVVQRTREQGL